MIYESMLSTTNNENKAIESYIVLRQLYNIYKYIFRAVLDGITLRPSHTQHYPLSPAQLALFIPFENCCCAGNEHNEIIRREKKRKCVEMRQRRRPRREWNFERTRISVQVSWIVSDSRSVCDDVYEPLFEACSVDDGYHGILNPAPEEFE